MFKRPGENSARSTRRARRSGLQPGSRRPGRQNSPTQRPSWVIFSPFAAASPLTVGSESDSPPHASREQNGRRRLPPETQRHFSLPLLSPRERRRLSGRRRERPAPPSPPLPARALSRAGARRRRVGWWWSPFQSTRARGVRLCAARRRAAERVHPVRRRTGVAGALDVQATRA